MKLKDSTIKFQRWKNLLFRDAVYNDRSTNKRLFTCAPVMLLNLSFYVRQTMNSTYLKQDVQNTG